MGLRRGREDTHHVEVAAGRAARTIRRAVSSINFMSFARGTTGAGAFGVCVEETHQAIGWEDFFHQVGEVFAILVERYNEIIANLRNLKVFLKVRSIQLSRNRGKK